MTLNPRQFWNSYKEALHAADDSPAGAFPNGSTVYDRSGRQGQVTAQHVGNENVNVQWKKGIVDVHDVKELHG